MSDGDNIDYAEAMAGLLTFIDDELNLIHNVVRAVRSAARLEGIEPRNEAEMRDLDEKVRAEADNGEWPKSETMRRLQAVQRDSSADS